MSDLSSRILNALDEAVAAEVGARLRQAAQNVPPGGGAPALPAHFEQSLQRLRTLHAQVKVIVGKTFGDAVGGLSLTAPQDSLALKMLDASERTTRPRKKRNAKRVAPILRPNKRIGAEGKKPRMLFPPSPVDIVGESRRESSRFS